MSKKLIKLVVLFMVFCILLGMIAPYIYSADIVMEYKNSDLKIKMDLPNDKVGDMTPIGENGTEIAIGKNMVLKLSYGNLYETFVNENKETLQKQGFDDPDNPGEEIFYLESEYFADTWNNEKYINNYFKEILGKNYKYKIEKTTLSGIPAWKCIYQNKHIEGGGYYWITIFKSGQYVFQADTLLKKYNYYEDIVLSIIDSYKIDDSENYEKIINQINTDKENREKKEEIFSKNKIIILVLLIAVLIGTGTFLTITKTKQNEIKRRKKKRELDKKEKENRKLEELINTQRLNLPKEEETSAIKKKPKRKYKDETSYAYEDEDKTERLKTAKIREQTAKLNTEEINTKADFDIKDDETLTELSKEEIEVLRKARKNKINGH